VIRKPDNVWENAHPEGRGRFHKPRRIGPVVEAIKFFRPLGPDEYFEGFKEKVQRFPINLYHRSNIVRAFIPAFNF